MKVCTCHQCRAAKRRASKNLKKRIRRMVNRIRRRDIGKRKMFYWA